MATQAAESEMDTSGEASVVGARVRLWVVVVLMALSFAGGFVIRGLAQPPPVQQPAMGVEQPFPIAPAPPLSDSQIQGGLPPGHPSVGPPSEKQTQAAQKKNENSGATP